MSGRTRLPYVLVTLLGLTVLGTVLFHTIWPGIFTLLRRDPVALADGQVWRLISPMFVQPDPIGITISVFALVAVIGNVAERHFGHLRFALLYVGGALAAHLVGEWWQPYSSGTSVAGCGALGGLAAAMLTSRRPPLLVGASLLVGLTVALLWIHDIHGVGLATGLVIGLLLTFRRPGGGKAEPHDAFPRSPRPSDDQRPAGD